MLLTAKKVLIKKVSHKINIKTVIPEKIIKIEKRVKE
jgi:hypothetical protein